MFHHSQMDDFFRILLYTGKYKPRNMQYNQKVWTQNTTECLLWMDDGVLVLIHHDKHSNISDDIAKWYHIKLGNTDTCKYIIMTKQQQKRLVRPYKKTKGKVEAYQTTMVLATNEEFPKYNTNTTHFCLDRPFSIIGQIRYRT